MKLSSNTDFFQMKGTEAHIQMPDQSSLSEKQKVDSVSKSRAFQVVDSSGCQRAIGPNPGSGIIYRTSYDGLQTSWIFRQLD